MTWFVVHTQPNTERRAVVNLRRQGFETYLPRFRKRRRHARRVDTVLAPLFPGYLFVRFDPERTRWRSINGTFSVRYLVCFGDRPAPLDDDFVAALMAREDEHGAIELNTQRLSRGDAVRIVDGAFADHIASFEEMGDRERVFLLLELLGRTVRVQVPLIYLAEAV
ncbi:MAG: transcriptional activator RfaH [Alphaproteobacteria bacterium]|nr:transcriptional activator RfaH [Alphaproteobacteria bacterium]